MGPDIKSRRNTGANQELPLSRAWHEILHWDIVWLELWLWCVVVGCRLSGQYRNVWHWGRPEHDCITTYPQVTHKIEMCTSREYQGANIINKINVQCVWINEHVLRSYITGGNKKRAQLRFLWVIGRNRGSYFYYLIGTKSSIFLSKFIKEKYTQVPQWGEGEYMRQMWKITHWGNTFHTQKHDYGQKLKQNPYLKGMNFSSLKSKLFYV